MLSSLYSVQPQRYLNLYVQFIEGRAENDTNSDSEDVDSVEDLNEACTIDGNSSDLLEQVMPQNRYRPCKNVLLFIYLFQ